jgi:hypothetical protein
MVGYIVRHRQLGLGKIESSQNRAFSVRFVASGQLLPFSYAQFGDGGSLAREVLGLGARCRSAAGDCEIERIAQRPPSAADPYKYVVKFGSGHVQVLSEEELSPILGGESADPQARLGSLQVQAYLLFSSRENLRRAYARMLHDAAGLRALLGSRVDLRPYQAFVAGTVLLEPRRRFILADEVGLGKTIEAGIVIHDLIAQRSNARILVLCPGALTQQWLAELYSKFGGHLFTLLDLHDLNKVDWTKRRLVICSTTLAALRASSVLEAAAWDMVVVDEAHHLLTIPALYRCVERLSRSAPAVLLLSAIPAHERADELLRLLALLEPERYKDFTTEARAQFAALHEQQPAIGKGLRVLERRLVALDAGEIDPFDVCTVARRILETPAVSADRDLSERLERLYADAQAWRDSALSQASAADGNTATSDQMAAASTSGTVESLGQKSNYGNAVSLGDIDPASDYAALGDQGGNGQAAASADVGRVGARVTGAELSSRQRIDTARSLRRWAHDVADRYRLSRRILRNRRARLIEQQQIAPIERTVDLRPYAPHRLELDASDALETLLHTAHERSGDAIDEQFLAPFAKICWQSASSPTSLVGLLKALARMTPGTLNTRGVDFLSLGQGVGYADWSLYRDLLMKALRQAMPAAALSDALGAAVAWQTGGAGAWRRLEALGEFLAPMAGQRPKLIVFAGYPGIAAEIARHLQERFGEEATFTFLTEQPMEEKENGVRRFQREPAAWLMVSDESGGEGRNFQFVQELVHFDTPWYGVRIEQRIGRLDRLGRERVRSDVLSHVFYSDASVEAGLVHCFDEALGVYRQSISGLEFALRDVERGIVSSALLGGFDGMVAEASRLASLVAAERGRDDAEAVLDEASYEASAASRFRAIARSDRGDAGIESAMVNYLRQITEGRGVRRLDNDFGPGAVVRFQPEKTCFGALPVDDTGVDFLAGDYDGTFRRSVAQQDPSLHFFNVSDPLFNAVVSSLDRHATGRTFALEFLATGRESWIGLECRFIPTIDSSFLHATSGLRNRLDALFVPKPVAVLIDLHGVTLEAPQADAVVALRRRLEQGQRGQTWWDLSATPERLGRALETDTWPDVVASLVDEARKEAGRILGERLGGPLRNELNRVAALMETLDQAANRGDREAADQSRQFAAYASVLPKWGLSLDALGIVSVNGRLRLGQLE